VMASLGRGVWLSVTEADLELAGSCRRLAEQEAGPESVHLSVLSSMIPYLRTVDAARSRWIWIS